MGADVMRGVAAFILSVGAVIWTPAYAHAPGGAQNVQSRLEMDGRTFALSADELVRLTELGNTTRSINPVAQDRALAEARRVAASADARYLLAVYQLEIGRQRRDDALVAPALDVLIADPQAPRDRLASWIGTRGNIAYRSGDLERASALWTRLVALQPGDPQAMMNLAQVRAAQNDAPAAIDLIRSALAAHRGGPAPEVWYRQWLSIAFNAHMLDQGKAGALALVAAYPTPANWRDALVAYRQLAAPQDDAEIDLLQLMRTAGALLRPAEYLRLAQLLLHAGLPAEARAVLDEGVSRRVVNRSEAPAPAIGAEIDRAIARPNRGSAAAPGRPNRAAASGQQRFAAAVAAYREGRRREAEAGFRELAASAEGQGASRWYPDLAAFWLAWIARSG
jgi:hypothetical protein